jgi:FkbM family methyltransferase
LPGLTLNLVGGIRICVPPDLRVLSTYVFLEQEDWFEAEAPFVRRLARPGLRAIDIGANFGFYALTLAKGAGPTGHVWGFEPAPATAGYFKEAIAANRLGNVTLHDCAIGAGPGVTRLHLSHTPELNSVVRHTSRDAVEVRVESLDSLAAREALAGIDFLKIDAEGTELDVLNGAVGFLKRESPLVMFEVQKEADAHRAVLDRLTDLGYRIYRHVPLLNALVPFAGERDAYLLNLFACKPDRAQRLAADGLLCEAWTGDVEPAERTLRRVPSYFAALPITPRIPGSTEHYAAWHASPDSQAHRHAIGLFLAARDESLTLAQRYAALESSHQALAAEDSKWGPRVINRARVAAASARRYVAMELATALSEHIRAGKALSINEPFLPLTSRAEHLEPPCAIEPWIRAMILEFCERTIRQSSYYGDSGSTGRLAELKTLGCLTPELERRRQLDLILRGGLRRPQREPLVVASTPDNLNAFFWSAG